MKCFPSPVPWKGKSCFRPLRHNSWVYNAGKFKYWVYRVHFSQAKLNFESPYILLFPVVSNVFLSHIYFCSCRVNVVHHISEKIQ